MKLFTKISLIVAAIAGGLGILGIIIGLALGADIQDLNNIGIYISPHQQVAVNGVITEVLEEEVVNEVEESFHIYEDSGLRHHNGALHDYSCSLSEIDRLKVEVQNAKITIFATEDENSIIYYADTQKNIAKVNGSTLELQENSTLNKQLELEMYLPIGVLREIEIEIANGSIWADRMVADYITIESDNALVEMDELIVEEKAELQVNAGQMRIGYFSGKELEAECAMGSVMVVCEGNRSDYNYDLECGMGNIQVDQDSYSGIGNELKVNQGCDKSIHAECSMGEIILEFPNHL